MNIPLEILGKVKKTFEQFLDKNSIQMDLDYPFYNVYSWKNDIIFSSGYRNSKLAQEFADYTHFDPKIGNAGENNVKWLGVLDCSRSYIDIKKTWY